MTARIRRGEAPLHYWQRYRAGRRECEAQAQREDLEALGQLELDLASRIELEISEEQTGCFD